MPAEFIFHNPPAGSKKSKKKTARKARKGPRVVSAKQRANWARFARMAKAKASAKAGRTKRCTRRRRASSAATSTAPAYQSARKGSTMATKSSRRRTRGNRRRAGSFARKAFAVNPFKAETLMTAAGVLAAQVAAPLITSRFLSRFTAGNPNRTMVANAGVAVALAAILGSSPRTRKIAEGMMIGAVSSVGAALAARVVPQLTSQPAAGVAGYDDDIGLLYQSDGVNGYLAESGYENDNVGLLYEQEA